MSGYQRYLTMRFGDVGIFDNTYNTNQFRLALGYFVGIDNRLLTILFAQCLLGNETTEAFEWLFEAYLEATGGHRFNVLMTDHDIAMEVAI